MGRLNSVSSVYRRHLVTVRAVRSGRSRFPLWVFIIFFAGLVFAGMPDARAAFVTTNEAAVDGVFSQASFGATPVDVVFNPTVNFANGDLLNINNETRLDTLFAFNDGMALNVISMYFVDTLDWCGSFNTSIVGCANFSGNDIVVESGFAAGVFGTELIAHEIGHSLDLDHVVFANLMTNVINGNTTLLPGQVATILGSSVLQMAGSTRFVEVTPVLVTPLPAAGIMFVSAIVVFFGIFRRRNLGV